MIPTPKEAFEMINIPNKPGSNQESLLGKAAEYLKVDIESIRYRYGYFTLPSSLPDGLYQAVGFYPVYWDENPFLKYHKVYGISQKFDRLWEGAAIPEYMIVRSPSPTVRRVGRESLAQSIAGLWASPESSDVQNRVLNELGKPDADLFNRQLSIITEKEIMIAYIIRPIDGYSSIEQERKVEKVYEKYLDENGYIQGFRVVPKRAD